MLEKTIKYTDFNDEEREEVFRFNLSKAELMELELGTTGGYTALIKRIMETKDTPGLIKIFKELILKSYGIKDPTGNRFIKSEEISKEFTETNAYSELFMELATNAESATEFVNGIIPANLRKEIEQRKIENK